MRSLVAGLCFVIVATTPALPQQKPADNLAETIQQLSKQWFEAFLTGDGATLDRMEAPDLVLTDGADVRQKTKPRAPEMKPRQPNRTFTMDDVKVRSVGDTAILTSHQVWKMNDGSTQERRVTEVWRRDGNQWRIMAGHSSEVPIKK